MRTACATVRAVQSIDYTDPSVTQSKYRVCVEIRSLAKVNVNKVAIFLRNRWNDINSTGMLFLSKYTYVHSVKAAQSELNETPELHTDARTNERSIT